MFAGFCIGLVLGAVAAYAFRGYISRKKTAAAEALKVSAWKAVNKL